MLHILEQVVSFIQITFCFFLLFAKVIDDILQNFDRKTIKKFLKRDSDGNAKLGKSSAMKDAYVGEKMSDKLSAKG